MIQTTSFNQSLFEQQPYVSNGYIGQRIPVGKSANSTNSILLRACLRADIFSSLFFCAGVLEGFGYKEMTPINASAMDGTSGWPLFDPRFTAAMVAGFYDQQNATLGTNFVGITHHPPQKVDSLLLLPIGTNWRRATYFDSPYLVFLISHSSHPKCNVRSWNSFLSNLKLDAIDVDH